MNDNRKWTLNALLANLMDLTYDASSQTTDIEKISKQMGWSIQSNRFNSLTRQDDITIDVALKLLACFGYKMIAEKQEQQTTIVSAQIASEIIKDILKKEDKTITKLSKMSSIPYRTIMRFFAENKIKAKTLTCLFNALDYEIVVCKISNDKKRYLIGNEYGYFHYRVNINLEKDIVKQSLDIDTFYKECCIVDMQSSVRTTELFTRYQQYAHTHRLEPMGRKQFVLEFTRKTPGDFCNFYGIKLN